jgi:hypothetical protein
MQIKSILKIGTAVVIVAILLIFLGVNFVPQIFASSSPLSNTDFTVNQSYILHSHYHNLKNEREINPKISFAGTDALATHLQAIAPGMSFTGTDALVTHLQSIAPGMSFAGTDALVTHLQAIAPEISFTGTDALLTHQQGISLQVSFTGTDALLSHTSK